MNDFEPGEGWREINEREWLQTPIDSDCVDSIIDGRHRRWVREVPALPLPTEPYTVIKVQWKDEHRVGARVLMHLGDGWWMDSVLHERVRAEGLVTGFEVLAEPGDWHFSDEEFQTALNVKAETVRRETAKAVLDRVRALTAPAEMRVGMIPVLVQVADEFGVES